MTETTNTENMTSILIKNPRPSTTEYYLVFAQGEFGQKCLFASNDLRDAIAFIEQCSPELTPGASYFSIEGWSGRDKRSILTMVVKEKYYIAIDKNDYIQGSSKNKKQLEAFHSLDTNGNKVLECEKEIFDFLKEQDFNPVWQYDPVRKIAYIPKKTRRSVWSQLDQVEESPDQTNEETCNYCDQNYSNHSEKLCSGT